MLNNKLSILVIARNEEDKLLSCLSKLRDSDELVVLLDRSKDNSSQIAKKFDAKVIEGNWPNEGKRRNFGRSQCAGDWILEIDADEFPYEPSTLNPGETGTLTANWHLPVQNPVPPLGYGEARAVTIGAANGSTADFAAPRGHIMSPC